MKSDSKPDLTRGFPISELIDHQPMAGKVGDDDVILVRDGSDIFAVGATCTHYHGALEDGLVVGDTIRCPLHHACFSLRSGEALQAPAFDPINCWLTEIIGPKVFVRGKPLSAENDSPPPPQHPESIVIIGGGAAGLAAAEMLRRKGYKGRLTMLSADDAAPYDRPNLSKDFLAGTAPDDWIPLRSPNFYHARDIDLIVNARVRSIDVEHKSVTLNDGTNHTWEKLLLATGSEPNRLGIDEVDSSQVFYLRSFDDSKKITEIARSAKRVVVIGSSFIGLEVASSLRTRGIEVHVVSRGELPLLRVLGEEMGIFIRRLHESHGVVFHLGATVSHATDYGVVLSDGTTIDNVDFIIVGAGVSPSLELATSAGLKIDRGVLVNQYLETSHPGVYAAGDIARWPDPVTGRNIRVEHWVVAERQGQVAAKNMLGETEAFTAVPFFWTQQYDVSINYVGHAEHWDTVTIDGSLKDRNFQIDYLLNGKKIASATVGRDISNLKFEVWMEHNIRAVER